MPFLCLLAAGCWSGDANREDADRQVYDILERTAGEVTGTRKTFPLERPVDTLRTRLLTSNEPVALSLVQALDVAAENSRDFQRQKEQLYLAALSLTRSQHDFALRFDFGGSGEVSGVSDTEVDASLRDNLSGSVAGTAGTRIVASFVNTFLRSLIHGGSFDGSSILNLTLTQPLLAGAGRRIVREPLTQAEREVVYQTRAFERFRAEFAVRVVTDYYAIVQQMEDLTNVEANHKSLQLSREQIDALYEAGRRTITDLGRAKQSEFSADTQRVSAVNRLQTSLDRFKITLGLPVTAAIALDPQELQRLRQAGVTEETLTEGDAIALALQRRFDHRTTVDEVEDAGRRVMVSEDALGIGLDFSAALAVPAETGPGLNLDWSRINWSAGFDLDLALDKLAERNAYRSSLISLDLAIRSREQSEDQIAADVRAALRNIQSALDRYRIQQQALSLAEQRVEATTDLYAAGRVQALEKLDAQDSLLQAQLDVTAAIVDYQVARLELLRDLEGIALEPKGLRFDPALPIPQLRSTED
ncbi:MAG: TolC family protein [Planctomycetes bacterium]|nr:TolC family protein [Planctomycetota bacterium]